MSDINDELRELFQRRADDVPPHRMVPRSLVSRARRSGRSSVNWAVSTRAMAVDWMWGWQFEAACRGEDSSLFFAPNYFEKRDQKEGREAKAKALCARCPVREECLNGLQAAVQSLLDVRAHPHRAEQRPERRARQDERVNPGEGAGGGHVLARGALEAHVRHQAHVVRLEARPPNVWPWVSPSA